VVKEGQARAAEVVEAYLACLLFCSIKKMMKVVLLKRRRRRREMTNETRRKKRTGRLRRK